MPKIEPKGAPWMDSFFKHITEAEKIYMMKGNLALYMMKGKLSPITSTVALEDNSIQLANSEAVT